MAINFSTWTPGIRFFIQSDTLENLTKCQSPKNECYNPYIPQNFEGCLNSACQISEWLGIATSILRLREIWWKCKTAVTPLLIHWSYHSVALSHHHKLPRLISNLCPALTNLIVMVSMSVYNQFINSCGVMYILILMIILTPGGFLRLLQILWSDLAFNTRVWYQWLSARLR